jgi:hypothetical protein
MGGALWIDGGGSVPVVAWSVLSAPRSTTRSRHLAHAVLPAHPGAGSVGLKNTF